MHIVNLNIQHSNNVEDTLSGLSKSLAGLQKLGVQITITTTEDKTE